MLVGHSPFAMGSSMASRLSGASRSRLRGLDLVSEALAGLLQRPARSALTMLGTVLGIAAFVTILGLTTTAAAQIDERFTVLSATEIRVEDIGRPAEGDNPMSFPADAAERIESLNGVEHAGVWWQLPLRQPSVTGAPLPVAAAGGDGAGPSLLAADPGLLAATRPVMRAGRVYDAFHQGRNERVAVLGAAAASRLGVFRLDGEPAVFISGEPYTVIGVIGDVERLPDLLFSVVIPTSTALRAYGPPTDERATMLIETRLGAAQLIAGQTAVRLRPDAPVLFKVVAPPDPQMLRGNVKADLNALFLLLAAISLVVGAVGIANTTLVAVLERMPEIGLRRALGARPRHVAAQFLLESTVLGALGGLVGTSLGVGTVMGVALAKQWTAVLQPWAVLPAPLVGALVGLLAGAYPALRAARVEPVTALRR